MYENVHNKRKKNPHESASLLRIFAFLYTCEIFKKSTKRDLIEDDLYDPLQDCETSRIGDQLNNEWHKETELKRNSLARALTRVFWKTYFLYGLASLIVKSCIISVKPLALGKLVSYFSPGSAMSRERACYYGALVVMCNFINSAFNHHYHVVMSTLGLKIKASITSLIYRKSLRLTDSSLMTLSSGKLITLINKDAASFESMLNYFHDLWIGLIRLCIISYIMYQQIQEAAFVGIGFLVVLIPVQVYIAKFTKVMRLKTSAKTDERLKQIQEILMSIKLLKQYNWTAYYTNLTSKLRIKEMKNLRLLFYLKSVISIISQLSQRLSFYLCILYYINDGNLITAEKIFVILGCYSSIRSVISTAIPLCVFQFAEAKSAIQRIKQCLLIEDVSDISDLTETTKNTPKMVQNCIEIQNVKVVVGEQTILENINFDANAQSGLIAIAGNVGSGKSTFLKMLLKQFPLSSGMISVHGSTSYASQEPWLFPGTIKQNILFGLTYNKKRYEEVIKACALLKDIECFTMQDDTIVSDKGLNLSKGQQARINLARAVYKNADIYLLDDVMGPLDASVCQNIFENCFRKLLKDKLVLFVCHNKNYLKMSARIVVLTKGKIEAEGQYHDLVNQHIDFSTETINSSSTVQGTNEILAIKNKKLGECESTEKSSLLENLKSNKENIKLYNENKREGKVKLEIYKTYLQSAGGFKIFFMILCLFIIAQTFISYFDYYIKNWIKIEEHLSGLTYNISQNLTNITIESETFVEARNAHNEALHIYSFLIAMSIVCVTIQLFTFYSITSKASKNLHNNVFRKLTAARMTFFDQNLPGNILNRFSKDIGTIDEQLPNVIFDSLRLLFIIISIASIIGFLSPIMIVPTLIMFTLMWISRISFLRASLGLKRLDGSTKAPVIGHLTSSLNGLTTIRASQNQSLLIKQFDKHQDLNTSAMFMYYSISRAFGFWLDCLCNVYIGFMIIIFTFSVDREEGSAGKVGLVILQASRFMGVLQWTLRQWAELENQMTCVERITEYTNTEQEQQIKGISPHKWPQEGLIEFVNVSLSYFTGQKILRNINLEIHPGERVGIVGRTGSGKSSLISALFLLYDIEGIIKIDHIHTKDIQLSWLRSKISIIPQDPIMFSGSIRTNLDPEDLYTDTQLLNALDEVQLKNDSVCLKDGLDTFVQESGGNFSVGQKQLICLARAILKDNKILVLDEATANIDLVTEAIVWKTIKRVFSHCTTIIIAHRLHTIVDCDRVIVFDSGQVVDFDSPCALLNRRSGMFYNMAKHAGLTPNINT